MPYVPIRLTAQELVELDALVDSSTVFENRSEVFRLLLHREVNRRKDLPKPQAKDWQTVFRPRAKQLNEQT